VIIISSAFILSKSLFGSSVHARRIVTVLVADSLSDTFLLCDWWHRSLAQLLTW